MSSNYQIVVPKDVRKRLGITKGQPLYVEAISKHSVTFTTTSPVDKYFGALKGAFGDDAIAYQRQQRQDREVLN